MWFCGRPGGPLGVPKQRIGVFDGLTAGEVGELAAHPIRGLIHGPHAIPLVEVDAEVIGNEQGGDEQRSDQGVDCPGAIFIRFPAIQKDNAKLSLPHRDVRRNTRWMLEKDNLLV